MPNPHAEMLGWIDRQQPRMLEMVCDWAGISSWSLDPVGLARMHAATSRGLDALLASDNPVVAVHAVEVRQSMHNGGGPACLRLRVPIAASDLAAVHPGLFATPALLDTLEARVRRHYRDRLVIEDLADPALLDESRQVLDEVTDIVDLPGLYAFQW